ncbi:cupin domain-containing protein [Bradyrhizobium manausense]|uniref:cupin domain-containing protein n=1 Tax=Bradyrhizobium TaxID=374 RepID=UPI001BAC476B|nr:MULTISPECIES: cupin domain-containing protein [Bradyrhizobium]MBR0831433.1 cupin domain-containing protein [Bradyrhizobium manausense]UVO26913.1 cupin domain-containing protein [Bradyrhizobium arachidis]
MQTMDNLRSPNERTYGLEHVAVGVDVRVSTLSLVGDECVPWHWHTRTSDIFFCLEGTAVVETHNPGNARLVNVGERYDVPPGVPHRVTPLGGKRCRFVLVQGVGKADFHPGRP